MRGFGLFQLATDHFCQSTRHIHESTLSQPNVPETREQHVTVRQNRDHRGQFLFWLFSSFLQSPKVQLGQVKVHSALEQGSWRTISILATFFILDIVCFFASGSKILVHFTERQLLQIEWEWTKSRDYLCISNITFVCNNFISFLILF